MNGWLKLWRKVQDNLVFQRDRTAWHIFEVLLINCDLSGKWSGGRFTLAVLGGEHPNTTYKALKRLEKAKMVTLSSNNKYTDVYICNWSKYQGGGNNTSNNKVTTKEQQSNNNGNTINKNNTKNKELRIKKIDTTTIVVDDYITFKETWKKVYGKYPTGGRILVDFPIKRLLKAYGIQEVCGAIIWAEKKRKVCDYIPSFNNPLDLERKWNSLINQYRKEQNAKDYIVDLNQV